MISIMVAAHNESSLIAGILSTLLTGLGQLRIGVAMACNEYADDAPNIARRFGPTG
jgi:hypothetical protein